MKSFVADSNSKYIQSIDLPAGQYTFSAIVKSPNMLYSFAIEEIGGWRTFDLNLHTTEFKKVSISFLTAKVTKFNLVSNYASPSNVIEIVSPMLNGGTIASPAKRHELDLTESITSQEIFTQYSKDGSSDWHGIYVAGDRYMRTKKGEGNWSAPMLFVGEDGAKGADGKYTEIEFAKNTSTTTAPTSGWQDAPPTASEGEYVWMRQGEVIPPETTPAAWSPAVRLTGLRGTNGISVTSVVIQYAKSESATVAPTSESDWGTTRPVWERGFYLWQRTLTTYSDGTKSVGTPSLDNTWQAEGRVVNLENKTKFLGTEVDGNAVATGTLIVGNPNGTNAGITGIGDENDIFLWGGNTFAKRDSANVWLKRNGHFRFLAPNGLSFDSQTGTITNRYLDTAGNPLSLFIGTNAQGNPEITFYDRSGNITFRINPNGIDFPNEVPESWTGVHLKSAGNSIAMPLDSITRTQMINTIKQWVCYDDIMNNYAIKSSDLIAYEYYAGQSAYSEGYRQYEGLKTSNTSRTSNINDGWYYYRSDQLMVDFQTNEPLVEIFYIRGGKNVYSETLRLPKYGDYLYIQCN